jgi:hypothetical protein
VKSDAFLQALVLQVLLCPENPTFGRRVILLMDILPAGLFP